MRNKYTLLTQFTHFCMPVERGSLKASSISHSLGNKASEAHLSSILVLRPSRLSFSRPRPHLIYHHFVLGGDHWSSPEQKRQNGSNRAHTEGDLIVLQWLCAQKIKAAWVCRDRVWRTTEMQLTTTQRYNLSARFASTDRTLWQVQWKKKSRSRDLSDTDTDTSEIKITLLQDGPFSILKSNCPKFPHKLLMVICYLFKTTTRNSFKFVTLFYFKILLDSKNHYVNVFTPQIVELIKFQFKMHFYSLEVKCDQSASFDGIALVLFDRINESR